MSILDDLDPQADIYLRSGGEILRKAADGREDYDEVTVTMRAVYARQIAAMCTPRAYFVVLDSARGAANATQDALNLLDEWNCGRLRSTGGQP